MKICARALPLALLFFGRFAGEKVETSKISVYLQRKTGLSITFKNDPVFINLYKK